MSSRVSTRTAGFFRVLWYVLLLHLSVRKHFGVHTEDASLVLTDTVIRALKPRQMRYLVTDGRGLCLEVLPSGKLSWLYRYRFGGSPEKVAIGHYPELSLKAARGERDRLATMATHGKITCKRKTTCKNRSGSQHHGARVCRTLLP